jgi:tetratricopeptide (TPR) repeat protein
MSVEAAPFALAHTMKRTLLLSALAFVALSSLEPCRAQSAAYDILISRGVAQLDAGDGGKALGSFEAALLQKPGDRQAQYYIALCRNRMGRYAEAAETLRSIVSAAPEYKNVRCELGIALFGLGYYQGGLVELAEAERMAPRDPVPVYYRGRCLLQEGRYDDAIAAFESARRLDPYYDDVGRYYAAVALLGKGEARAALDRFRDVAALPDASPQVVAAARENIRILTGRRAERLWRAFVSTRYEYDSNVTLMPDDASLVEATGEGDFRFTVEPAIEFTPHLGGRWETQHLFSFIQSVHHHLGAYNLQGYHLGNRAIYAAELIQPFIGYNYEYYFLDDNKQSFVRSHILPAGFTLQEGRYGFSEAAYTFEIDDYLLPYECSCDNRSADDHSVGISQYLFAPRWSDRYLRLGFFYDRNNAEGRNYTYDGYRFFAGFVTPVACGVTLDFDAELYVRDFFSNLEGRDDTMQAYVVTLSRRLNEYFDVGLQYTFINNNSNVALFEYHRNIFSLMGALNF